MTSKNASLERFSKSSMDEGNKKPGANGSGFFLLRCFYIKRSNRSD